VLRRRTRKKRRQRRQGNSTGCRYRSLQPISPSRTLANDLASDPDVLPPACPRSLLKLSLAVSGGAAAGSGCRREVRSSTDRPHGCSRHTAGWGRSLRRTFLRMLTSIPIGSGAVLIGRPERPRTKDSRFIVIETSVTASVKAALLAPSPPPIVLYNGTFGAHCECMPNICYARYCDLNP
jgi:hypothetical protein